MIISTNQQVDALLIDIQSSSPEQYEMVVAIRSLFMDTSEALCETVKYGGITFTLSEVLIGGIFVYTKHISIEFSDGASFVDTDALLQGGGKKRRHLKIVSLGDIAQKKSEYFIAQAIGH